MPPPTRADTLLVTTIARHFPAATVIGTNLELGVAGLELGCRVGNLRSLGGTQETAQLVLELRGGRFPAPIPMTMTGYADTSDHAIVDGADAWAAAFGPVLRAALAGAEEPAVARLAFDNHGRGFRSYVDAFDRVLPFAVKGEDAAAVRARLVGGWLTARVLHHPKFPALPATHPSVLSIFIGEMGSRRIVEIKLDDVECAGFDDLVARAPITRYHQMALLRELAILVPDAA